MSRSAALIAIMALVSATALAAETSPLPAAAAGKRLNAICFADAQHGWIVGEQGLCLATSDGGETWEKRETGSGALLRDVRFRDALNGWACGEGDPAAPEATVGHVLFGPGITNHYGTCLATEDGGKTWRNSWVTSSFELPAIEVSTAPALQLGVGGVSWHVDGDILRSADGGKTWNGERAYRGLFDIRAVDAQRWVAVGAPVMVSFQPQPDSPLYLERGCRVLISKDSGVSWAPTTGSDGSAILRGAAVKAGAGIIAVGDEGSIIASDDSGETWKPGHSGTANDLRAVAYTAGAANIAVAVGVKGTARISRDNGRTWQALVSGSKANLQDVCALGEGFVAVGEGGTVVRLNVTKPDR